MKSLLFLIILIFTGVSTYAQHANNFNITGHIKGKQTKDVWFRYPDVSGKIIQQKVKVNNNAFIIAGYIASPTNAEFANEPDPRASYIKNYFGNLFISPGSMTLTLNANDLSSTRVYGSVMQSEWVKLQEQKQPLVKQKDNLNKRSWSITAAGNTPANHKAKLKIIAAQQAIESQELAIDYGFIQSHPGSYLSAYLTAYYLMLGKLSRQKAIGFYKTFSSAVKSSISGTALQKQLTKH